jgi:hypothetical protein
MQKAVRRGDTDLVTRVASHLREAGQARWLQTRSYVIAFEECWPILADAKGNSRVLSSGRHWKAHATCRFYLHPSRIGSSVSGTVERQREATLSLA